MDTRHEILRDEWWERHKGMCPTCGWRRLEDITHGYVCCNSKSEKVADWVEENDGCEEWFESRRAME